MRANSIYRELNAMEGVSQVYLYNLVFLYIIRLESFRIICTRLVS